MANPRSSSEELERARALGFDSVQECDEHQVWLARQAQHRDEVAAMVETGN